MTDRNDRKLDGPYGDLIGASLATLRRSFGRSPRALLAPDDQPHQARRVAEREELGSYLLHFAQSDADGSKEFEVGSVQHLAGDRA